jgi:hypothetical protein
MQRRTLLRRAVAVGAVGLAGCGTQTTDAGSPTSPTPATSAGERSPTTAEPDSLAVTDRSISTVGSDCRSDHEPGASIAIPGGEAVTFRGQVTEDNPCYQVRIAGVSHDEAADRLTVDLETVSTQRACTMCLGIVEFEGRIDVEGPSPTAVTLRHGETVLGTRDATGDGGTATGPIEQTDFTVLGEAPASQAPEVDVAFNTRADRLTVHGTIEADTPCQTAQLARVDHDDEADRATIAVGTTRRPGTEGSTCSQQVVGVAYETTVSFESSLPTSAAVVHDDQSVVTASHE